ncbi:MAG: type II toxin-antitoxin system prevent-host-death family antitoxin [Betaproteobacteria bacterium]|nr:type II toxin-antitoxin system prevent-host-death family antitoxin [Betaproteobacteria bacterium]
MQITNISKAKSSLSSLIAQVEKGHKVIIGKAGKPVAMLVPYRVDTSPRKLGGTWSRKVKMAEDFDTLPPELAEAFYGNPAA